MYRFIFVPFIACSAAFASAAQSDFKSFITGEVKLVSQAFANKDAGFFKKIAAPGFTETEAGGKTYTAAQAMQQINTQFAMCKSMTSTFKVVSAKSSGNTGTAVTHGHATIVLKPGKDGKSHVIAMDDAATETWVRIGKSWKIKSLVSSAPTNMTMDGKPMKGGQM